ncbi:signal peptidase I [Methanobacterium aggregans]|uniref:signal peptidase I n=3 Tax=Methanobacterium aggregans TaxID=1615586 RepID=UPI001AE3E3DC|nr:signal peptidase I [Methanobacterium aggregans]MBP2046003.1 signal peptidase [Methanobacterium aggregans]
MSDKKEIISYIAIIIIGIILAQHMNVVVSGSMEPVFYRGDIVVIEKTDFLGLQELNANDLKVGDIVVYHATWFNEPVIHRIIQINQTSNGTKYFVIKGDNNPVPDPAVVYPNQIVAKVVTIGKNPLVIPRIGYITIWIRGL